MSAHTKDFYWNRSNGTSCISTLIDIVMCQRFIFHNVTVVRNRAEYAGGVFCSIPDCIAFSCSPENQTKLVTSELNAAAISRGVIQSYCSDVHLNEALGRVNSEGPMEAAKRCICQSLDTKVRRRLSRAARSWSSRAKTNETSCVRSFGTVDCCNEGYFPCSTTRNAGSKDGRGSF